MTTDTIVVRQNPETPVRATPAHRRPPRRWHLPRGVAFYLQASIITLFLAASSAPTPLYAHYQAEWHFSPIGTTVAFGIYALAVLAALLVFGRLSDHIGRRPVLLAALAVQAASMVLFAGASSLDGLVVARIVQGLATGTAAGAVGAGLLDLDRARGTVANAVAPLAGTATGGVIAAVLIEAAHTPAHVVYLVFLAAFAVQFVGIALTAETSSRVPGAPASLKPEFALPAAVRGPVLRAIPALVAIWGLAGFFGALGPALLHHIGGSATPIAGGLVLFVLAGVGALSVLVLRDVAARTVLVYGAAALLVGVALTLVAVGATSVPLFFVAGAIAGSGFGASFNGAVRTVVPLAAPHQRAGVLSLMYVVSYLALGLPAVLAGLLVVHEGSLTETAVQYGVAVLALALVALLGAVRRPQAAPAPDRAGR